MEHFGSDVYQTVVDLVTSSKSSLPAVGTSGINTAANTTFRSSNHAPQSILQSQPVTDQSVQHALASALLKHQLALDELHSSAQQPSLQFLQSLGGAMMAPSSSTDSYDNIAPSTIAALNASSAAFSSSLTYGPSKGSSLYRLGISPGLSYAARPRPSLKPTQIVPGCTLDMHESSVHHSSGGLADNGITSGLPEPRMSHMQMNAAQPYPAGNTHDYFSSMPNEASTQGPRVAEMSICHSKPSVVTPTGSFLGPMTPTMLTTNVPFVTGYGHQSNFPVGTDFSDDGDVPTYTYGRLRRYNEKTGRYGEWEQLLAHDPVRTGPNGLYMDRPCIIHLKRGGMIRYFPRIISEERREYLAEKCRDFQEYRQYKFGPGGLANEPRVHVLLSTRATRVDSDDATPIVAPGYQYHGIRMQAQPLSSEPAFEALSAELAAKYHFPKQEWNIGCDAIVYRNGNDNIGWHSDDTQGESKVTCICPQSPGGASRPVYVRPKKNSKAPLLDGDEEIQLFVRQGDGYEMDGVMQDGYEHCLPKVKKVQGLCSALIFRQGRVADVHDSGKRIADTAEGRPILAPPPALPTIIGHPPFSANIVEGNDSYSRAELFLTRVHRCDRRGVCGNIENGAESIVVSRQDSALREEDGLQWLKYTSSRRQGGGGFATSFKKKQPIRVFRSSSLNNKYAPPPRPLGNTSYRYDGLYRVLFMWNEEGNRVEEGPAPNGAQYTFLLRRLPKVESAGGGVVGNILSTNELWRKICQRNGKTERPFVPIQPTTHLKVLGFLPPSNRHRTAAGEKSEEKGTMPSDEPVPFRVVDNPAEVNSIAATPQAKLQVDNKRNKSPLSSIEPSTLVDNFLPNADDDNENNALKPIEINWVQCDQCNKWRILRECFLEDSPDSSWRCAMNTSDPYRSNCAAPEETEDDYIQSLEDESEKDDDSDYVPPPTVSQIMDSSKDSTQKFHNKAKNESKKSKHPTRKKNTKRVGPSAIVRSEDGLRRSFCGNDAVPNRLVVKTSGQGQPFSSEAQLQAGISHKIQSIEKNHHKLEPSSRKTVRKRKRSNGSVPRKSPRLNNS